MHTQKGFGFLWFLQDFIRHGTLSPTIKQLKPRKDRIFVLGNGPSLKNDITPFIQQLQNEDVLMVNQALTHSLAFELQPRYYVLMDPAYWGFYTDEEDIDGSITQCVQELSGALRQVTWQLNLLAPFSFYKKHNQKGIILDNPHIKPYTFNAAELKSFAKLQKLLYEHNFAIPSGINVLIASLCVAITLGYKEIYLLGADSNWHKQLGVDSNNRVYSLETHYYHDEAQKVYAPYCLSFHLSCVTEAFKAYDRLGALFPQIKNLSSTSMIDAFARSNLESILAGGGE